MIGIFAIAAARRRAGGEEATGAEDPQGGSDDEEGEPEDDPSLMRAELPFGPFLAMAAVFYLFAEPTLQLHFRILGG